MHSTELKEYFRSIQPGVKRRTHDGLWAIWFPLITTHEDNSWSLNWEIRGTHKYYEDAIAEMSKLSKV